MFLMDMVNFIRQIRLFISDSLKEVMLKAKEPIYLLMDLIIKAIFIKIRPMVKEYINQNNFNIEEDSKIMYFMEKDNK
jgi:hypothetical protein